MMSRSLDKVWGVDHTLYSSGVAELHVLEMKKGGYTSNHLHRVRASYLRVIEGVLKVKIHYDHLVITRALEIGQDITIPLGYIHQLEAVTDCKVLELYEPNQDGDIERFDEGGVK